MQRDELMEAAGCKAGELHVRVMDYTDGWTLVANP